MAPQRNVIAIVDDDPAMRGALENLLRAHGYGTEVYASGTEFIDAAATTQASCLVVDIELGDMTGVEMNRRVSDAGFAFPVVFITGSVHERHRRQAMEHGCAAYLLKPFSSDRLIDAIEKGIECGPGCTAECECEA